MNTVSAVILGLRLTLGFICATRAPLFEFGLLVYPFTCIWNQTFFAILDALLMVFWMDRL
jgi:hypothetical protein